MKLLSQAIEQFLNTLPAEYDELISCHNVRTARSSTTFLLRATAR